MQQGGEQRASLCEVTGEAKMMLAPADRASEQGGLHAVARPTMWCGDPSGHRWCGTSRRGGSAMGTQEAGGQRRAHKGEGRRLNIHRALCVKHPRVKGTRSVLVFQGCVGSRAIQFERFNCGWHDQAKIPLPFPISSGCGVPWRFQSKELEVL